MILKRFNLLIIVILLLLSACTSGNTSKANSVNPTDTSSSSALDTPIASTIKPTNTLEPFPTPTIPPAATITPEPSPTTAVAMPTTPVAAAPTCTNRATLVRHLSFGDNSSIAFSSYFNKVWRIQNSGTCTWTTSYAFVFSSGEQMNAPAETPLPREVPPGETIDIQIVMKAPDVANSYNSNWMLRDSNGTLFGTGESADQPIAVNILVKKVSDKDKFPAPECG